jgi:hypothetical protein
VYVNRVDLSTQVLVFHHTDNHTWVFYLNLTFSINNKHSACDPCRSLRRRHLSTQCMSLYATHVDPSVLVFSLSSHRHSYIGHPSFRILYWGLHEPSHWTEEEVNVRSEQKDDVERHEGLHGIPIDLSTRPFIPLPRFIHSRRPTSPYWFPSLISQHSDQEVHDVLEKN